MFFLNKKNKNTQIYEFYNIDVKLLWTNLYCIV